MGICELNRHPLPVMRRAEDGQLAEHYSAAVAETLRRLGEIEGRPAAMEPFDSLFRDDWRAAEIADGDQPVVGLFCNFVPEEIVIAAGAIPLRLELGQSHAAELGSRLLPVDCCPEIKAIVGAELGELPLFSQADLLVLPTACDGKKKIAGLLGEHRPVWLLQLPQTKQLHGRDGGERQRWYDQIRELAKRIAKLDGARRLRRKPLLEAIALVNRRVELVRELSELRWQHGGLLSGRDLFLMMHATFFADVRWWIDKAEALLEELRRAAAERRSAVVETPRVLLTGSPVFFPNYRVLHLIEEAGAEIIADEMCSGTQRFIPTVIDERTVGGLLRAAADRALLPCTCPCFVQSDDRIDRLLELVERSGARAVVHHTLRLCHLYDMELQRVTAALKQRGIPIINIYTEYGEEDSAVIQNRLEAFVEMLVQ